MTTPPLGSITSACVDPDGTDENGETRLHRSARDGRRQTTVEHVQAGDDPNARNHQGETPLLLAVRYRRESVVDELLNLGADANATTTTGLTPLMVCAHQGERPVVTGRWPSPQQGPGAGRWVMRAENDDWIPVTRRLLEAGANPHAVDAQGNTAAHHAVRCLHVAWVRCQAAGDVVRWHTTRNQNDAVPLDTIRVRAGNVDDAKKIEDLKTAWFAKLKVGESERLIDVACESANGEQNHGTVERL